MARCDDMMPGLEDEDSEDEQVTGSAAHRAKPRRKSNQRPQGSDQIRQAFSKRKKGLVLKAYQLSALTDAKVFMFIVNDKGTSWAYATPGFGSSLNPELLKELRVLAQVPEQAKLVTEMMPDPPNAKTVDTTGNPGLTVVRGADQVPGSIAVCTRAQSTMPTRSRSSCSGGSAGETSGAGDAPINQGQTVMQSDERSPTRLCARPPPSSSVGPGRSVPLSQMWQQQRSGMRLGASMEPPTPCGIYNLLGQPAAVAATESPTIISGAAAPATATNSKQLALHFETVVDSQPIGQSSWHTVAEAYSDQQPQHRSEQAVQALQPSLPQLAGMHVTNFEEGQQQMNSQRPTGSIVQQQHDDVTKLQGDDWKAADGASESHAASGLPSGAEQQNLADSGVTEQLVQSPMYSSTAFMAPAAAAQMEVTSHTKDLHRQYADPCASAPQTAMDNSSSGLFESMLRDLPPIRVQKPNVCAGVEGAYSAPGGVGGVHSQSVGWVDTSQQARQPPLRSASDAGVYLSSSGYTGYLNSLIYDQQGGAACSRPANCLYRYSSAPQSMPMAATTGLMGQMDPQSATSSPTAALSQQMVSLMAMETPAHYPSNSPGNLYQQVPIAQLHVDFQQQLQQQQFSQQSNQGSYIPRTDDLVADPLMDMLMDQALSGGLGPRALPQQQQSQHTIQLQPYCLPHQLNQQQQQQGTFSVQEQLYNTQDISHKCAYVGGGQSQQSMLLPAVPRPAAELYPVQMPSVAPVQQQFSPNYLRMMELFKCMPLVSDPARKAWEEQVRQMKTQLAPHEQKEFATWVRGLLQPRESSMMGHTAAGKTTGGYAPRMSGTGGKQIHGPSRLSATVGAAALTAALPNGMPATTLTSSCGMGSQIMALGAVITAPSSEHSEYQHAGVLADAGLALSAMPVEAVCGSDEARPSNAQQMAIQHGVMASLPTQVSSQHTAASPLQYAAALGANSPMHAQGPAGEMQLLYREQHCSSPLKRSIATVDGGSAVLLKDTREVQEAMSPLKRSCRTLPEAHAPVAPEHHGLNQSSMHLSAVGAGNMVAGSFSAAVQACTASWDGRPGLKQPNSSDAVGDSAAQTSTAVDSSAMTAGDPVIDIQKNGPESAQADP